MVAILEETRDPDVDAPQWCHGFLVDGERCGAIGLAQVDRTTFRLTSRITFHGDTGLGDKGLSPEVLRRIRTLDPADFPGGEFLTDLASVPQPIRWFLGSYGEHTPAALIHDWLIPTPDDLPGMTDVYADRYLRFMLQRLGMKWLKRWIMWAAVALRSRFAAGGRNRALVVLWVLLAVGGIATAVVGAVQGDTTLLVVAALLPFPSAVLWEKQYGAGLIAALAAPWLLPPTVLAVLGYGVYLAIEWTCAQVLARYAPEQRQTGTYLPGGV